MSKYRKISFIFNVFIAKYFTVKVVFYINKNISELRIFDLTGKLVKEFKGSFSKGESFDISNLSRSLYILKITNNSGQQQATKLVKL